MAKDSNNSGDQNSSYLNQDDSEKSLVGKFKSIISNTPLSKWFRRQESTIRRRDDEEDYEEEADQLQPPAKRAKFAVNDVNLLPIKTSDNMIKDKLINRNYNTFPEPVAGPSGLQSRKLLNSVSTSINSDINVHLFGSDFLNGHKDSDSEESTSGYSSVPRIGSKEHVCQSEGSSKQPSPLQTNSPNRRSLFETPNASITNRSLFVERTTSPQTNTSMSSRRPQFNASTFGSPNFIDQTLSTEKVISSPFYSGSTMYGGASAYGNKFGRRARDLRASMKRPVHIRPIKKNNNEGSSNLVLGKTARKILETLEQYNSPVNDAKKIPVASKRARLDTGLLGKHVGVNPFIVPSETASNKELQVPTVSDLLKMKQKAKLQSSTEAVRQIATSSKSGLNNTVQPQQVVKNVADANVVVTQKIEKPKEYTQIDKPPQALLPNLPKPTLLQTKRDVVVPPIMKKTPEKVSDAAPPTFVSPAKLPNVQQQPVAIGSTKKYVQKELPLTSPQFKFSDPLVIAENLKSIVAMNNFKFSDPLCNLNKTENAVSRQQFKEKNNGQTVVKEILANSAALFDKFKAASGTWECGTCLIRNQPEKTKCVACETPKLKPVVPPSTDDGRKTSFGDTFKLPDNMWECSVCMIRNWYDCAKCVACQTPNPKSSTLVTSSSGFQGKFQSPANTWECSTCLIINKEEVDKCAACETPRVTKKTPAADELANSFKKKADEWECPECMVTNKETLSKCQCCEVAKPGSSNLVVQETEKKPIPKFNFGIDKASAAQFKFGIQPSSTAEPAVPKLPDPVAREIKTSTVTAPTFSFGSSPAVQKKPDVSEPVDGKLTVSSNSVDLTTAPEKTETVAALPKIGPSTAVTSFGDKKDADTTKPVAVVGAAKPTFSFAMDKPKDAGKLMNVQPKFTAASTKPTEAPIAPSFTFGRPAKPTESVFGQPKLPAVSTVISGNNGLGVKPAAPAFAVPNRPHAAVVSPAAKPFSFARPDSNGEPARKAPMFNFGQTASQAVVNATTTAQPFGFGQPTAAAKVTANEFNVGNYGKAGAENSKIGSFNFGGTGQNTSTQKTGFNFGAAPASSTFNLGGAPSTTQTAQSGGFNFSTSFDANVKPSFNFSEGSVTTFSAQPSSDGGAAAPRKIKKAVRRTQR